MNAYFTLATEIARALSASQLQTVFIDLLNARMALSSGLIDSDVFMMLARRRLDDLHAPSLAKAPASACHSTAATCMVRTVSTAHMQDTLAQLLFGVPLTCSVAISHLDALIELATHAEDTEPVIDPRGLLSAARLICRGVPA